jgi:glycosyltransferase involved in cell wall biosynthesis
MQQPWLSVIIPCRNGQRWLAAALQSIVDQRESGIEAAFIDASDDNACLEITESFSDQLHIRTFHRPDLSYIAATNFGVGQARADHICILHVDDLWLPDRCAYLRKWLSARPDALMHLHSCYIIDETGKRVGIWRCPLPNDELVPTRTLYERLLIQNFISTPTITVRRDAYLKVGGLDDAFWYTADWDFYLKIVAIGDIFYHSQPLACYRVHKNSLTVLTTMDSSVDFRTQHQMVVDRHIGMLPPDSRNQVLRLAAASMDVNTALAAALTGHVSQLVKAALRILGLGPRGIHKYLVYSRITDRLIPRVRAHLAGKL